jgi:hypothetical protein
MVHDRAMTNWNDIEVDAPELAALVRGRFGAHGLGYLATLRRDGAPRISGVEPLFADHEVWLGMMWESRKALDLRRDGRCSLHSANVDKDVAAGDARIDAVAVEHTSEADLRQARQAFAEATGYPPTDGAMHLFRLDIAGVVFLRPAGDHLEIRSWTPGTGERIVERT